MTVSKLEEHSHEPQAIAERLAQEPKHSYLRDFIYGAIDGTVTTFAVVAGVAGAGLSSTVVIILGLANVVADGFSMAVGNYLGTRSEREQLEKARRTEYEHIRKYPEGEKEEIRQIFAKKGFSGEDLDAAVKVITSDVEQWVNTMIQDEIGMRLYPANPWRAAAVTFAAFIMAGLIPLISFFINWLNPHLLLKPFIGSSILAGITFFIIGSLKSRYVLESWWRSGLETLLVGIGASVIAYYIGFFLRNLIEGGAF